MTEDCAGSSSADEMLQAMRARLTGGVSPVALSLAMFDWAAHLAELPQRRAELTVRAFEDAARLATSGLAAAATATGTGTADGSDEDSPRSADRRFADPSWGRWPFNAFADAFVLTERWWQDATTGVPGVSPHHQRMVSFAAQQLLEAISPTNYFWSNPEVLDATAAQRGENLLRGAEHLADDWQRMLSGDPPEGTDAYVPGESVAVTPGTVVYRNRLIELIQYAPATKTAYAEPVLIVPAWIMKYYILDLSPHNSLVRYLVEQGHTVFMISWHNPAPEDSDLGMEDYLELGLRAALDVVSELVPGRRINAAGYCLGGTLLAIKAAAMARDGDDRLRSLTLLAAQTEFSEPGEIGVLIDDAQVTELEHAMRDQGYLDSQQMGSAFAMLRSYDLIYSRLVSEYLLGERRLPNDLMAWNADGTRLPYRMHSEYLESLFLRNELFEGRFSAGGRPVALSDIRVPTFIVSTVRDHVAPWHSVYKFNLLAEDEVTFLLTSGGHNAGIVSEPGHAHRRFQHATRAAGSPYVDPDRWARESPTAEGSWWPVWHGWLAKRSGRRGAPPALGAPERGYPPLGTAPGDYVLEH